MWARTENGYGLVYCQNIQVVERWRRFAIAEITPTDMYILYTCKTEEQALRVLDKIQHHMMTMMGIRVLNVADCDTGGGE